MAALRVSMEQPPHLLRVSRTTRGIGGLLALLLMMTSSSPRATGSALNCHKTCVCASNIVSCSKMNLTAVPSALPRYTAVLDLSFNAIARLRAEWTPVPLSDLHSLLLSQNGLTFLSSEAFVYVTRLRYLDLSSNGLRILDEYIFEPLVNLEVLLLYNNHISQIDRTAFSGLAKLQKLYMSQNQISRFPLELVKERSRLEKLSLLDVSSNRIKAMPLLELQLLPAWIKNGLYFHSNPLPCSCELYTLLAHWLLRELSSVVDYQDEHTCILPGTPKVTTRALDLTREHLNCSEFRMTAEEAYLDQVLTLGCDARQYGMKKTWLLPGNVQVASRNHSAATVLLDGSLQVGPLRPDDSGVYTCVAVGDGLNETLYVTVSVHNFTQARGTEGMNTAYTTLVGCLASVVLVLIYLYLTPCRCFCCPGDGLAKSAHGTDSLRSSSLSVTPTHAGGAGLSHHVGFLNPKDLREQNGRLTPSGEEGGAGRADRRRKSDADSVSSVCSDTPIVV